RNSVRWGNGVWVSRDAGATWTHAGLAESRHIGKIAVHPSDPEVAYVAALGHLWKPGGQRGLFRTSDGGRSWRPVLVLDADTGCIDVVVDPKEPRRVYAAAYAVRRGPFSGGNPRDQFGPRAGIYCSDDGGETWRRLTRGLPTNQLGRIGLAVYRGDPRVIYAVIQTERTDIRTIAGQAPGMGPVEAGGVFVSRDRGETWTKVNHLCPRPFYFGKIRIDPGDERRVWVLGVTLFSSVDGGRSFQPDAARGIHLDHHDLWIQPGNSRHMVLAGDGGLYHSQDAGQSWLHVNRLPIGQFYGIDVDARPRYRLYGGLQDNGTVMSPEQPLVNGPIPAGDTWKRILSMDGFSCRVSPEDPNLVYAQGQYGRLHRVEVPFLRATSIRPNPTRPGVGPFRFNWSAPLAVSSHDPRVLYYGGNVLFHTRDRGQSWRMLSGDLTRGRPGQTYAHMGHTLTAIAESPREAGLLYVGSDDGRVHVTRDGGKNWTDISDRFPGLPADGCITRIACCPRRPETAWLASDRHALGDDRPHLYRTDDHGQTWTRVVRGLPAEGPISVILADDKNPDLLYLGTEFGLHLSLDGGSTWQRHERGLPSCPVVDIVIQRANQEMILATHGNGLFSLDVSALRELTVAVRAREIHLFPARTRGDRVDFWIWRRDTVEPSRTASSLEIIDASGTVLQAISVPPTRGLHRLGAKLRDREGQPLAGGIYRVRLKTEQGVKEVPLEVPSRSS
ncbi:MAG: WD40/YVTN/BNR-like repeat-containing protein, partial [Gemmataceae bacterium]